MCKGNWIVYSILGLQFGFDFDRSFFWGEVEDRGGSSCLWYALNKNSNIDIVSYALSPSTANAVQREKIILSSEYTNFN